MQADQEVVPQHEEHQEVPHVYLDDPSAPKQIPEGYFVEFDDKFKFKFLRAYIQHAPDLWAKKSTKTGKAPFLPNLRAMLAQKVAITMGEGELYFLFKEDNGLVAMDTLAQYLSFKGFSKQKKGEGLMEAMTKWQEGQVDKSADFAKTLPASLVVYLEKYMK